MFSVGFFIFWLLNSYFVRFDLELDKFGVDVQVHKEPVIHREFGGWTTSRRRTVLLLKRVS